MVPAVRPWTNISVSPQHFLIRPSTVKKIAVSPNGLLHPFGYFKPWWLGPAIMIAHYLKKQWKPSAGWSGRSRLLSLRPRLFSLEVTDCLFPTTTVTECLIDRNG
jgi:hypothetical protein